MSSDEIRALLERGADRDLGELESRALENALASDPSLAESLLDDPVLDAVLRDERVPLPTELEWKRIGLGIDAGIGAAQGGPASRVATPGWAPPGAASHGTASQGTGSQGTGSLGTGAPRIALWKVLVPLAAAAVLCAVVIRSIVDEGLAIPDAPIVEVDLPDDRPYLILPAAGEDGGVMIYITSG